jgi:hypothetical protein
VDVLVAVLGHERPALDVDPQPVERVEHRLEGGVVEQARPVQDPGVGTRPREVVQRQSPVEVRRLRQRREGIRRTAGETATPQGGAGTLCGLGRI